MQSLGNESDGQKEERQGKRESLPSDPESHKKNSQAYEMSLESYIRQSVGERKMKLTCSSFPCLICIGLKTVIQNY